MGKKPIITIDGPAGAGKSTVSRMLAERLSFVYLDTGALYRAVAFHLRGKGYSGNPDELPEFCRGIRVELKEGEKQLQVIVDGEDVTGKIRSEEIGLLASRISAVPCVREVLLSIQRKAAAGGGVVAEGRDMGTVVFPDAEIKFFLDASPKVRAGRRYRELLEKGTGATLQEVAGDLERRDRQDRERPVAPLAAAPDAVHIDSTQHNASQVVNIMMRVIEERGHSPSQGRKCP